MSTTSQYGQPTLELAATRAGVLEVPPRRTRMRYGVHLALIAVCTVICIPALYALQVATLNLIQAFQAPPQLFPPGSSFFDNVRALFERLNFGGLLLNTTIVSLVVVISKTALAMLAGLAFVYFRFPARGVLFIAVLLTLLMPTEIILLPLYRIVAELGWAETNPYLTLTVPFIATATGVFLFRQHFSNIPRELAEAAQIDGATPLRFMVAVLIPMSWNVIVAHALIQFISSWNQYLWPVLVLQGPDSQAYQVIQVGIRRAVAGPQTDFGMLMAAGIVASIPPLLLFVLLQKQFMSGFAITRDK